METSPCSSGKRARVVPSRVEAAPTSHHARRRPTSGNPDVGLKAARPTRDEVVPAPPLPRAHGARESRSPSADCQGALPSVDSISHAKSVRHTHWSSYSGFGVPSPSQKARTSPLQPKSGMDSGGSNSGIRSARATRNYESDRSGGGGVGWHTLRVLSQQAGTVGSVGGAPPRGRSHPRQPVA